MRSFNVNLRNVLPAPLYAAQLVHRRAKYWEKEGLIFIHVPKNGGVSINRALYGRFMGHYTIAEVARWSRDLYASLPSLGLSRNPWARVTSAYQFARAGRSMIDGAQIHHPQSYQIPVFDNFERFVVEWLDGRDLSKEDLVFRPQSNFLVGTDGRIGVTHVGRLESPVTYTGFLEEVLGRHLEIERLNKTSNEFDYKQAFTLETRNIVARVYAEDIKRFNYDF